MNQLEIVDQEPEPFHLAERVGVYIPSTPLVPDDRNRKVAIQWNLSADMEKDATRLLLSLRTEMLDGRLCPRFAMSVPLAWVYH